MIHKFATLEELVKRFNPELVTALGQAAVDHHNHTKKEAAAFNGFVSALVTCDAMSVLHIVDDDEIKWDNLTDKLKARAIFFKLHKQIEGMGLKASAATAKKIVDSFDTQTFSVKIITNLADDLCKRLKDEAKGCLFYSIDMDNQHFITDLNLFGDEVANRFRSANFDIEEAGKCMAFDRWTASAMHSMRVLEVGLTVLAKDVGVVKVDRSWEQLIRDIEGHIPTASIGDKAKEQFYAEAALQFRYFKNASRNPAMHGRDTYDEERAETFFRHVQEFMVHLATRLKEDAP